MITKKAIAGLVATATLATGFAAVPAEAHRNRGHGHGHGHYDRYDDGGYSSYDNRGYYGDRREYRRSRCGSGTGGTIIGAVVGGLAGREIARRGNRTEGAVIGAAAGALAGRALGKASSRCR
jgi:Glycine zipper 2TM domain